MGLPALQAVARRELKLGTVLEDHARLFTWRSKGCGREPMTVLMRQARRGSERPLPGFRAVRRTARGWPIKVRLGDVGDERFEAWHAEMHARAAAEGWHLVCTRDLELDPLGRDVRIVICYLVPDAPAAWHEHLGVDKWWRRVRVRRLRRLGKARFPTVEEIASRRDRTGELSAYDCPSYKSCPEHATRWLLENAETARALGYRLRYRWDAVNCEHGYVDVWLEPREVPRASEREPRR